MDYKGKLIALIKKEVKSEFSLEIPPDTEMGDYALACFKLSKEFKKSPQDVATHLKNKIKTPLYLEKIEVKGPYLNFFIKPEAHIKELLSTKYKKVQKSKILVEMSSPNTNKPLHLGHLRNMAIGMAVSNILKYQGNTVNNVEVINDRGIHICKSMLAYQKYGKNKKPNKKSDHFVGDFYVLYNKEEAKNKSLEKEAQEMLLKWEQKDKKTLLLWEKMNKWVYDGFNESYKRFGTKINKKYYESKLYTHGKEIVREGIEKGIFTKDEEGSTIFNTKDNKLGKKVLLRPDGTSLYIIQDIFLDKKRYEEFKMDKIIHVVGSEQKYHFEVLFKIFKALNYSFADGCYHLAYGMVYLPEGKMKSREGTVVDADNIMEEVVSLAKKEVERRHKLAKKEVEKRAEKIGICALKFHLLKYDTLKGFVYNPKESISFEGDTGPYIQYTYARINSILRKVKKINPKIDHKALINEKNLLITLADYGNIIDIAGNDYKPHILCHYLLKLCQQYNSFYANKSILGAEKKEKDAYLYLSKKVQETLKEGLNLLGIDVLSEM